MTIPRVLQVVLASVILSSAACGANPAPAADTVSPYTDQLSSPVRGLSQQEVDDLQAGRGAGYARSAELNGYPGPRHVLDLADQLALDDGQREETHRLFEGMQRRAQELGAQIVAREQQLSHSFESGVAQSDTISIQLAELGGLYAELRGVHLSAHLALRPLLNGEQLAQYEALRGYTPEGGAHTGHHG